MPFIPQEDVEAFLYSGVKDPAQHSWIRERLRTLPRYVAGSSSQLLKLLAALPHPDPEKEGSQPLDQKVKKIRASFSRIAEGRGGSLSELRWWTIDARKRHLMGTVLRPDGVRLFILFMWKKTADAKQDLQHVRLLPNGCTWARDLDAPYGWRFEIEGNTYEEVKDLFDVWLTTPLPLRPSEEMRPLVETLPPMAAQ